MVHRRGLGRGLGKGYKNIVPRDPYIHGLSARGVSTQLRMDKSRLKNLMREYRDHIITRSFNKQQHKPLSQVVEEVDDARKTLEFGLDAKGTWKPDYVPKKTPRYEYVWGGDVFDDDNEGLLFGVEDTTDFPEYVEWFSSWEEREKNSKAGKMNIVNREQHYDYLKRKKILDAKMFSMYGKKWKVLEKGKKTVLLQNKSGETLTITREEYEAYKPRTIPTGQVIEEVVNAKGWKRVYNKDMMVMYRQKGDDDFFPQVNVFVTDLAKKTYEVHYVTRKKIKVLTKNVPYNKAIDVAKKFMEK